MRRKPTTDLDFGADDILGGLGFDEPTVKAKGPSVKKNSPEKTRSLTDKSSFMSSLFGGEVSDKKVEKPLAPPEKEFVLSDKYKKTGNLLPSMVPSHGVKIINIINPFRRGYWWI